LWIVQSFPKIQSFNRFFKKSRVPRRQLSVIADPIVRVLSCPAIAYFIIYYII
jgi:hypothetical protein